MKQQVTMDLTKPQAWIHVKRKSTWQYEPVLATISEAFTNLGMEVFRLSAPKSQRFLRFAIAMPIAEPRNRAISETRESNAALRFKGAMESRYRLLRFRAAISEPQTPSFCGISGDLAPSTRKSLAIAIVRCWCAKIRRPRMSARRTSGSSRCSPRHFSNCDFP